ncbi:MAG: glycosyltransferase [Bacteroidetes bacterium]|jgi:rSAM/selenodomain-associated transferase 2|nr:glycosyltransferase [Bacteroidota bacterium]
MNTSTKISIIIPCLNEEGFIAKCVSHIFQRYSGPSLEVIIVDGGSQDSTLEICKSFPCQVICTDKKSRAIQMNLGAKKASGNILLFLHADVIVPSSFDAYVCESIEKTDGFGLFAYDFYPSSFWLRKNAWFTRKKWGFSGGGDQGLFLTRELFEKVNGFNEGLAVMEDFDLFDRLKKTGSSWEVIQSPLKVSSRKYQKNSYLKVQLVNFFAVMGYRLGIPTRKIRRWYKEKLM